MDFLEQVGGALPACRWWGSIGTTACLADAIYFQIGHVGAISGDYYLEVGDYQSGTDTVGAFDFFLKDKGGSPPNCTLTAEDVTQHGSALCDATGATCTVDSV